MKNRTVLAKDSLGNLSKGEFTGYSNITNKYYVSFYNGDTKAFTSLNSLTFLD